MKEYIDIHCHCLPGVDDGPERMEESLRMLVTAYRDGIRSIVATPHYYPGQNNASPEQIREKLWQLKTEAAAVCPKLSLYLGNELYYNSGLPELLAGKEAFTMADSSYVLMEFAPEVDYTELRNGLYSMQTQGFWPILAHVERYQQLLEDMERARELIEMGVYLQANASSILGRHGRREKRFLRRLLEEERLHFVATDAHDLSGRPPVLSKCAVYLEKKYGERLTERLLHENPRKMMNNELL